MENLDKKLDKLNKIGQCMCSPHLETRKKRKYITSCGCECMINENPNSRRI